MRRKSSSLSSGAKPSGGFRSQAEVIVAGDLTRRGFLWEYEKYFFKFQDVNYLPDFYLPTLNVFIEVKAHATPKELNEKELLKLFRVCEAEGRMFLALPYRMKSHKVCYYQFIAQQDTLHYTQTSLR